MIIVSFFFITVIEIFENQMSQTSNMCTLWGGSIEGREIKSSYAANNETATHRFSKSIFDSLRWCGGTIFQMSVMTFVRRMARLSDEPTIYFSFYGKLCNFGIQWRSSCSNLSLQLKSYKSFSATEMLKEFKIDFDCSFLTSSM